MASSSSSSSSSNTNTNTAAPQILSRAALSSLIQSLDASDVLECYHLTRHAPLQFLKETANNTTTTSPSSITIPKSAIGLRYTSNNSKNLAFELTLEYGPQRVGALQEEEASLIIQSESYVSWQNEAKIYYSRKFNPQEWDNAQYMASISGVVLRKLVEKSVEYVQTRRRYQPFVVVSAQDTSHVLLKSSSSGDYVSHVWQCLAKLGVELRPILPPSMTLARLHVLDIQKVASGDLISDQDSSGMVVSQKALTIYSKLSSCIAAIATGDYSLYEQETNTNNETTIPTIMNTTTENDAEQEEDTDEANDIDNSDNPDNVVNDTGDDAVEEEVNEDADTDDQEQDDAPPRRLRLVSTSLGSRFLPRWMQEDDLVLPAEEEDEMMDNEIQPPGNDDDVTDDDTDENSSNTAAPSTAPSKNVNEAEEATKAAKEAKAKAHEAKEAATSEADNKAAEAAEAAANAAQKAADVTSQKQKQVSQKSLLSGDGELMSASLVTCFTNPQYQLVEEDGNSALFYLYLDGATYYRLNLTMPYLDVAKVDRPIPLPPSEAGSGGGDFIDWTLAIVTIGFLVVGVVLIFQRIGFKFFAPLYKLQKWFFSPTENGYDSEEEEAMKIGQGFEHAFGEDVIPFSMGGRRPHTNGGAGAAALRKRRQVLPIGGDTDDLYIETRNGQEDDHTGDVEMVGDPLAPVSMRERTMSSGGRKSGPIIMDLPDRLARDPDLVDLPNLSSRSKVAVPVAIEHQQSNDSKNGSRNPSDDEGDGYSSGGSNDSFT